MIMLSCQPIIFILCFILCVNYASTVHSFIIVMHGWDAHEHDQKYHKLPMKSADNHMVKTNSQFLNFNKIAICLS